MFAAAAEIVTWDILEINCRDFIIYPVHLLSLSSFPPPVESLINAIFKASETNYYKNIASGFTEMGGWHEAFLIPCSA